MQLISVFAIAATLVASAAATPTPGFLGRFAGWDKWGHMKKRCLDDKDAAVGADIFRQLIQDYSVELALEALTEDFVDWTSAVSIIRNRGNEGPFILTDPTFVGRDSFMAAQGSQPKIPFETLGTWHGCDTVSTRWFTPRSANGQPTEANDIPVVGLAVMETVPDKKNKYGFRIKTLYSEFNAAAWLVNLGVFTPVPNNGSFTPGPPPPSPSNVKRGVNEPFFGI